MTTTSAGCLVDGGRAGVGRCCCRDVAGWELGIGASKSSVCFGTLWGEGGDEANARERDELAGSMEVRDGTLESR